MLNCYETFYRCVFVRTVCMGDWVCVCTGVSKHSWMLIFIYKGAYCNFSLWGFYDTVWRCFLAKLVAARHVLYYSSELCAHSSFLVSKWSFEENFAFYRTVIFDWFHSNLYKQKPEICIFWIVWQYVNVNWFPDRFGINRMNFCPQILPLDYADPRSTYFLYQYLQL